MVERRKHKRGKSPQLLPIFDRETGEQLGMLVDLSFGGLLMIATSDLMIDDIHQLQISLPQSEVMPKKIEFTAEVVWSDTLKQNETCWAGFQIIDISDYELDRIGQLVDLWSLDENRS